jgi:hypothetical protein
VIAMHVGYKNFHFLMKACASHNHLPLNALSAVKHYLLVLTLYQNGWQTPFKSGNAARRAQKYHF